MLIQQRVKNMSEYLDENQKKSEKSFENSNVEQEKEKKAYSSTIISQYSEIYNQFFSKFPLNEDLSFYEQRFKENKIIFERSKCQKQLTVTAIHKSRGSQVLTLYATLSHFTFEVTLLNLAKKSQFQEFAYLGKGTYGCVCAYKLFREEEIFALKHLNYEKTKKSLGIPHLPLVKKKLIQVIKQYCFCKLFSVLEIGPCVSNILGFDILVFNDCIEFAMEMCQKAQKKSLKKDLCSALKLMHSLDIIHGDIKPQNVLWSPKYEKNVFIDFGYTQLLKQKQGYKTLSNFFGTYTYSSPEMKKIFDDCIMSYVDLYYNDLYGLKILLEEITGLLEIKFYKQISSPKEKHQKNLLNIKLMSLIYEMKAKQVQQFLKKYPVMEIIDETMMLFLQLEPHRVLDRISRFLMDNFWIPPDLKYKVTQYQSRRMLEPEMNKNNVWLFQNRIQEILTQNIGSVNDMMIFAMLLGRDNPTPSAAFEKKILLQKIQNLTPTTPEFWRCTVKYLYNLYVSKQQYDIILQHLKKKLNIKKWNYISAQQLQFFNKVYQIAEIAITQYNINIFELYGILKKQFLQEVKEKLNQSYFKNVNKKQLIKFIVEMKGFQQSMYYDQKRNQQLDKILQKGYKQLKIQKLEEKADSLAYYFIQYFKIAYKVFENNEANRSLHENFLSLFSRFEPIKRIYQLSRIRYGLILRTKKGSKQKFTQILHFFKSALNVSLNMDFYQKFQSCLLAIQLKYKYSQPTQEEFKELLLKKMNQFELFFPNQINLSILHYLIVFLMKFCLKDFVHCYLKAIFDILSIKIGSKKCFSVIEFEILCRILQAIPSTFQSHQMIKLIKPIKPIISNFQSQIRHKTFSFQLQILKIQNKYHILDINQQYKLNKNFIIQNFPKLLTYNDIYFYQQILINCIKLSLFRYKIYPKQQFELLRNLILKIDQKLLAIFLNLDIGYCLSLCYGWKDVQKEKIDDFIHVMFKILEISSIKNQDSENFTIFAFIKHMIDQYFYCIRKIDAQQIVMIIKTKFYTNLVQKYREKPELFLKIYSNAVFIFLSIFHYSKCFYNREAISKSILMLYFEEFMRLASYWIAYSDFYFARTFRSYMNFWISELTNKRILQCDSWRKTFMHQLRLCRNFQFKVPKIDLILQKINNIYPKAGITMKIVNKFRQKFEYICQYKTYEIEQNYFTKFAHEFKYIYNEQINKVTPNQGIKDKISFDIYKYS